MRPQLATPSPERAILIYWRLPRSNGRMLACTSYRTPAGLELRAGLEGEPPERHVQVVSHAHAQQLAQEWKVQLTRPAAA